MSLGYAAAQVRDQDHDRFHLALAAPRQVQEGWLALAAFNLELARTASRVSDPNLGLIRLEWWREVLQEIDGNGPVRGHEVARSLESIGANLDTTNLSLMINARAQDLEERPFADVEALRAYLLQTAGVLQTAQAGLLGLEGYEGMSNHLGCAFGFVGCARALAAGRAGELRLPEAWMAEPLEGIAEAIGQAAMHLDRAQELRKEHSDPKALRSVFATGYVVQAWINRLSRRAVKLGQGSYARPLPFQALRLALLRA